MKQKDILYLSVSVFILIVAWVTFSVMHNFMTTTISEPTEKRISPISPNFDLQAIARIKNKEKVEPLYELKTATTPSPVAIQVDTQPAIQADTQAALPATEASNIIPLEELFR